MGCGSTGNTNRQLGTDPDAKGHDQNRAALSQQRIMERQTDYFIRLD